MYYTAITFHTEVIILILPTVWSALGIEITPLCCDYTVLKAAALGVGVTMCSAGLDIVNRGETFNPRTMYISGYIDV